MNLETVAIREIVIEMIEKTKTEKSMGWCSENWRLHRLLEIEEKKLLTIWVAGKVLDTVEGEDKVKRDAVIYGIFA